MMGTDRQVGHTADLAPATVTQASEAPQFAIFPRRWAKARARADGWATPVVLEQIPDRLLASSIEAAGGDPNRLWFGKDGAVWVLNHVRGVQCPSRACPACNPEADR